MQCGKGSKLKWIKEWTNIIKNSIIHYENEMKNLFLKIFNNDDKYTYSKNITNLKHFFLNWS